MTDDVVPITLEERLSRIQKAQRLMVENKIEALILDTGTSMQYFTGVGWWPSERTMVAIMHRLLQAGLGSVSMTMPFLAALNDPACRRTG